MGTGWDFALHAHVLVFAEDRVHDEVWGVRLDGPSGGRRADDMGEVGTLHRCARWSALARV